MTVRLRSVALPSEHGGWSLTLEPALLGLIVAPTGAGFLLALAALLAFVVRSPLRLVLVDLHRRRWLPRSRLALRVAAAETVLLAGVIAGAIALARAAFWTPLVAAAPLVLVALAFDAFSRSRRLGAEVAGSVAIASVAAAIALAGGEARGVAFGLWLIAAARAVAAIGHVRVQVRRAKDAPAMVIENDAAQAVAVVATAIGAAAGIVPPVAAIAIAIAAATQSVLVRRGPFAVAMIGAQQVVLGLAVVLAAGLGVIAP